MKKLLKISFLALLASCGGKESESTEPINILENLTYSVDTVMVNPGEDFLNLSNGLFPFSITGDKKRLYFFERDPYMLVEVDLDNLKVLKKTEFEEEGPDGIGSYLSGLEIIPTGNFFLRSNVNTGIFDQNAKKLQNLKFVPAGIDSTLAKNYHALFSSAVYDFEAKKIYTQPSFNDAGEYGLFILNPETKSARSLPIPEMKIVDDYSGTITIESGGSTVISFYAVASFITFFPGELILSNSAMSGIYRYDTQTEKLEFIDIQHQTVPNLMDFEIIKNPTEIEQVGENQKKIEQHLNFMEMKWDDSRQMYFRFGIKTFKGETQEDPTTYENYLFAYDKNFNVLGETRLEGLKSLPWYYFYKDGKLWSYVNVEDELGFAVMDFKF